MRKRYLGIFLMMLLLCTLTLSACGDKTPPEHKLTAWLEAAQLDAEETPQELYEKALTEDTLIIYSESTRIMDVAKTFMAAYPGLTVSVRDVRANDIVDMLNENFDTENYSCDVVLRNDNDGTLSRDFIPRGVIYKYTPYDIAPRMLPGSDEETLLLMGEGIILIYNDAIYGDMPVTNWWELTEEQWRGKVITANPMRSISSYAFFSMILNRSDLMEEAYELWRGKPYESMDGLDAGHYFMRLLVENGLALTNSSDEAIEAIGLHGTKNDSLGIIISSKLRMRDIGFNIAPAIGLAPFDGVYSPNSISIAGGAPNINTAKLFIRWIYGEADGQGEGYLPYLQSGAWSMRGDVENAAAVPRASLDLIDIDRNYSFENRGAFTMFWEELLTNRRNSTGS